MAKTILITGATAGIGKACAEIFAKNGWNLILTGRRKDRLVELQKSLDTDITILCFDVSDQEATKKAIDSLGEVSIDVLLNNAGLARGQDLIQNGKIADWDQMIDTNIKGLLYVTHAVLPLMLAKKNGHIINTSSIAGKITYEGSNVYSATKHAVKGLTSGMQKDLLGTGIKVSAVCPAATNTEFASVRFKGDQKKVDAVYEGYQPLVGEDIAEVVYFMATRPDHVNISDVDVFPKAQTYGKLAKE